MGGRDDRVVRRLEAQIAGIQRRLGDDGGRDRGWVGFLGGVALGTLAGALLALAFAGRGEEEPIEDLPRADDAIVLRERPQPARAETSLSERAAPVAEASPAGEAGAGEPATAGAATTPGKVDPVDGTCPESYPIKGNHSSSGDFIYHVPGSRNYERTTPNACFATEADAEAAGFRAPRG